MDSVQLNVSDSVVSLVVVCSSSATGMKPESRVSKSKSSIWLITALVYAIPPERCQYGHSGFKKLSPRRITSSPVAHADVALICELDEQWTFVGSKALQHWLWYAYNTKTGGVLAYTFGPRDDETCRELLALLTPFSIGMITSDDWGSYAREVPKEKHLTGKIFTQRIERNNLTLRTRIKRLARKTICFSRSIDVHEKVIGSFIEKYMFY